MPDTWTQVDVEIDQKYLGPNFRFRYLFGSDAYMRLLSNYSENCGWLIDDVEIVTY